MFDTIKLRLRHEERHKDGEKFECETCNREFSNEKNLAHHIRTHHCDDSKSAEAKLAKKRAEQRAKCHTCHICGPPKLFCLTSLRRHIARYTTVCCTSGTYNKTIQVIHGYFFRRPLFGKLEKLFVS